MARALRVHRLSNSIDVTAIAESMKGTFILLAVNLAYAELLTVPGLQWLGLPIISSLFKALLTKILTIVADAAIMEAFFIQTAMKKANQAGVYVDAVKRRDSLPPTATDEEYRHAEIYEMAAFSDFVRLG